MGIEQAGKQGTHNQGAGTERYKTLPARWSLTAMRGGDHVVPRRKGDLREEGLL
jgi:hypothetical protein